MRVYGNSTVDHISAGFQYHRRCEASRFARRVPVGRKGLRWRSWVFVFAMLSLRFRVFCLPLQFQFCFYCSGCSKFRCQAVCRSRAVAGGTSAPKHFFALACLKLKVNMRSMVTDQHLDVRATPRIMYLT